MRKGIALLSDIFMLLTLLGMVLLMTMFLWYLILIYQFAVEPLGLNTPREVAINLLSLPTKYDTVMLSFMEMTYETEDGTLIPMKRILNAAAIQGTSNVWVDGSWVDASEATESLLSGIIDKPYILRLYGPEVVLANNIGYTQYINGMHRSSTRMFLTNGNSVELQLLVYEASKSGKASSITDPSGVLRCQDKCELIDCKVGSCVSVCDGTPLSGICDYGNCCCSQCPVEGGEEITCESLCDEKGYEVGKCSSLVTNIASSSKSFVVSAELISSGNSYTDITDAEARTLFALFKEQGFTEFTMRLPAFSYTSAGATATEISNIKRLMKIANEYGLDVNLDLHTWSSTWDSDFRDSASNSPSNRDNYIQYMTKTIPQFENEPNLKAWMVLNEPQARTASASENSFISRVISTAKSLTEKPVSVRFMMGYSPSTGHYASSLDSEVDFLSRNFYWDSRNPSVEVNEASKDDLLNTISKAHNQGKEIWITEFGKKTDQANYFKENIAYYKSVGVDRAFAWAIQTEGTEEYNIFSGNTPSAAFYELKSSDRETRTCEGKYTVSTSVCSSKECCCTKKKAVTSQSCEDECKSRKFSTGVCTGSTNAIENPADWKFIAGTGGAGGVNMFMPEETAQHVIGLGANGAYIAAYIDDWGNTKSLQVNGLSFTEHTLRYAKEIRRLGGIVYLQMYPASFKLDDDWNVHVAKQTEVIYNTNGMQDTYISWAKRAVAGGYYNGVYVEGLNPDVIQILNEVRANMENGYGSEEYWDKYIAFCNKYMAELSKVKPNAIFTVSSVPFWDLKMIAKYADRFVVPAGSKLYFSYHYYYSLSNSIPPSWEEGGTAYWNNANTLTAAQRQNAKSVAFNEHLHDSGVGDVLDTGNVVILDEVGTHIDNPNMEAWMEDMKEFANTYGIGTSWLDNSEKTGWNQMPGALWDHGTWNLNDLGLKWSELFGESQSETEFLIRDETYTFNDADCGWRFWDDMTGYPDNWHSPVNFWDGKIYYRYEIISQPTDTDMGIQFMFWNNLVESPNKEELWDYPKFVNGGAGSVAEASTTLHDFVQWEKGIDLHEAYKLLRVGISVSDINRVSGVTGDTTISCPSWGYGTEPWNHRSLWFPLKVRFTIVAVAAGTTFSGWDKWLSGSAAEVPSDGSCSNIIKIDASVCSSGTCCCSGTSPGGVTDDEWSSYDISYSEKKDLNFGYVFVGAKFGGTGTSGLGLNYNGIGVGGLFPPAQTKEALMSFAGQIRTESASGIAYYEDLIDYISLGGTVAECQTCNICKGFTEGDCGLWQNGFVRYWTAEEFQEMIQKYENMDEDADSIEAFVNTHQSSQGSSTTRTNFAPLNTWTLIPLNSPSGWSPSFWDTDVKHDGNPSIRNEGYIDSSGNYYVRELNRQWTGAVPHLTVQAGDQIVFGAWLRTDPATTTPVYPMNGARVGVDFATDRNEWIDGVAYKCTGGVPVQAAPNQPAIYEWYVPMGSDWTYREMSFTVPTGVWGTTEPTQGQIIGMALWFQVWTGYTDGVLNREMADAWISDTTLYIYRDGKWL